MALEITVGPPRLAINQGYGVLITEQDGQIGWPTDKGFYHADTRVMSSWQLFADGQEWDLLNSGNIAYWASRIFLTNKRLNTQTGVVEAKTLGLSIGRSIAGGIHEDLDLVNHGEGRAQFNLEIAIRSDFADLFEVKSGAIVRRGQITTDWSERSSELKTCYRNKDFIRELITRARRAGSKPLYANGRISFEIDLAPGETWHACMLYSVGDGRTIAQPPRKCIDDKDGEGAHQRLADWRTASVKVTAASEEFYRFFHQSMEDMAALRLPIESGERLEFVPAAGIPWFVALFGRDSLIVSLQNAIVYPHFAKGALEVLSRFQAKKRDDWRDAEPGKIMHEYRRGELAHFKLVPHTPYYGTADATILYLMVLHNAWRCTGEEALLRRHLPAAEKCLRWIDHYGDRDGDGFQEYQTRSPVGYANQGWKDSGTALVYPDGRLVETPIALVELQGYVYDAWLRMAEVYEALGNAARARRLRTKARELFEKFNDAFWDEKSGFYAFALDGKKNKVLSVASNPGHCLWTGIVPKERADKVVRRLMEPDMWSGWGIRTLSADHPAYNPHDYQVGAVWPHDNAFIALGFRRYGFAEEACRLARDLSGAASYFMQHQMPELYSGLTREPTNFPVQYLGANVPQAWAAGSCFALLQMMLGFAPDAPAGKLYLDPYLPDWMGELTVRDLHVGDRCFDLKFSGKGADAGFEVLSGPAEAVERRSYVSGPKRWD